MPDGPVHVSAPLQRLIEQHDERMRDAIPCTVCHEKFLAAGVDPATFVCQECMRAAGERARVEGEATGLIAQLESVVGQFLADSGMAPRELRASVKEATREVWGRIPQAARTAMRQGELPERGFGISGSPGSGKTGALAALTRAFATSKLQRDVMREGRRGVRRWLVWLSWPETVNRLRVTSTGEGGISEVDRFVEDACSVDMLVLDDLGAERIKGSYLDDWAASQLDLIVDGRYRNERPVFFTTTLGRDDLIVKYGARLFSRLCGENDLIELAQLRDRRTTEGG